MREFLIVILSLFVLVLPVPARADGISSPMRNAHCAVPDKNGNAVFQGLPDLNGIRSGNHTVYTLLDSGYKYEEYTGIHPQTLVWRKVSAYFFTASASVNMTVSFTAGNQYVSGSISVSQTSDQVTTIRVDADQTRYSKIPVYTSFYYQYYRADVYDDISQDLIYTYYYTAIQKTHEDFRPIYD